MQVLASRMVAVCLINAACGGPSTVSPGGASGATLPTGPTQPTGPPSVPTFRFEGTAKLTSSPTDLSTPTQMDGRILVVAYDVPTPRAQLTVYYNNNYDGRSVYGSYWFAGGKPPTPGTYTLNEAASGTGAVWGAFGPDEYTWEALKSPGSLSLMLTEVNPGAVHGTIHFAEKFSLDATF